MREPEMAGFSVARMVIADADGCVAYAALPECNEFVSSTVRSAADAIAMIGRSLSDEPNAAVLFAIRELGSARLVASISPAWQGEGAQELPPVAGP